MIKKLLILSSFSLSVLAVNAQNDTLLYENFDVDPTATWSPVNNGNDLTWVNYDADGIANGSPTALPQEWFWDAGGFATVDELDGCIYSSSWLVGFAPGNRNWLITPPIFISDANASLSWKSAPYQTPLYLDGYTVMVSTSDNLESSFTDTLFQGAQYLTGSGNDFSAYTFSPGFVHGQDGTYIEFGTDSSRFLGEQRPFSESLAAYAGQTIYIAFLHDSDDDNLFSLDDILVTGTLTGLSEAASEVSLSVFPNPASDKVELSYSLSKTGVVTAEIFDVKGSKVMDVNKGVQIFGAQKMAINVSEFAAGLYNVVLNASGKSYSIKFVKE